MRKNVLFLLAIMAMVVNALALDTTLLSKPEVTFKQVAVGAITIDGDNSDDAWADAAETAITGNTAPTVTTGEADLSGTFKGAWSDSGVYILVTVSDDVKNRKFIEGENAGNDWDYDNVEFFFNPFGQRDTASGHFAAHKASQARVKIGDEEKDTIQLGGRFMGVWMDAPMGTFDWAIEYSGGGYVVEAMIEWDAILPDTIGTTPVAGLMSRWGFGVNVGDADEALRDNIICWSGQDIAAETWADGHWDNVNYMGVLLLEKAPIEGIEDNVVSSFNVYPNPATNVLNISGATEVSIYNITGQLVKSASVVNGTVDVANLVSGVYVVKAGAETKTVVIK